MSWARGCTPLRWGLWRRRIYRWTKQESVCVHSCVRWAGGPRSGRRLFDPLERVRQDR